MFRYCNSMDPRVFSRAMRALDRLTQSFVAAIFVMTLAPGVMLFSGRAAATAEPTSGIRPCLVGHLFEPGPIVNGHHRQPTQGEIDERLGELWTSKVSASSCR
jgi:hypothetical protein